MPNYSREVTTGNIARLGAFIKPTLSGRLSATFFNKNTYSVPQTKALIKGDLSIKLSNLGQLGTEEDLELLQLTLSCLNDSLLQKIKSLGFIITVVRDNLHNSTDSLSIDAQSGKLINDLDSTLVVNNFIKNIIVRSYVEDGILRIDFKSLIFRIAAAIKDSFFPQNAIQPKPTNTDADNDPNSTTEKTPLEIAFEEESQIFSNPDPISQKTFIAEIICLYFLDPEKLKRTCPLSFNLISQIMANHYKVNIDQWTHLFKLLNPASPFETDSDIPSKLEELEQLNQRRKESGLSGESAVVLLSGEKRGAELIAKELGNNIILRRENRPPFDDDEGFIKVTADLTKDIDSFFDKFKRSRGGIFYIDDVAALSGSSQFLTKFEKFCERHNGWFHLIVAADESQAKHLETALPSNPRFNGRILPLKPAQAIQVIIAAAAKDGYRFDEAAIKQISDNINSTIKIQDCLQIWIDIKHIQNNRIQLQKISDNKIALKPEDLQTVLQQDILASAFSTLRSPEARLEEMIGLDNVKSQIKTLLAELKISKLRSQKGLGFSTPMGLNYILYGEYGTGKSTVAQILAEIFTSENVVTKELITKLSISEMIEKGSDFASSELRKAKGGVIIFDDFHLLNSSTNTNAQDVLELIASTSISSEWSDTAFIVTGYRPVLEAILSNQKGLSSSFHTIAFNNFEDSTLVEIALCQLKNRGFNLSEDALPHLVRRIKNTQRNSVYSGNVKDVTKTIEQIIAAQGLRLSKIDQETLTDDDFNLLIVDDLQVQMNQSPDEVLEEINQLIVGNQSIKDKLYVVYGLAKRNLQLGYDAYKDIPMSIAIDGPPGTGKTTTSRLIAKLYMSLGILPNDNLVESLGGMMVGAYLGNSSAIAVADKFQQALGGTLFIDEISSMITSGEFSSQSIKEMLRQMDDNKTKVLVIIADYQTNIDRFLAFDGGLARRFKYRMRTEKMSHSNAIKLFDLLVAKSGYTLEAGVDQIAREKMLKLVNLEGFASGSDVTDLISYIASAQVQLFQNLEPKHKLDYNWSIVNKEAITLAFDEFISQVAMRPGNTKQTTANSLTRTQTAVNVDVETARTKKTKISKNVKRTQKAIDTVNKEFSDIANNTPEEFKSILDDKKSIYYQRITEVINELMKEELLEENPGVTEPTLVQEIEVTVEDTAEAIIELMEVYEEVNEVIDSHNPSEGLVFDYHCPYCSRINSMSCDYYSNSQAVKPVGYKYDYKWLMVNSMSKPNELEYD